MNRRPAVIAFAALGVIWGSNFLFMKWAAALISPMQTVILRVLFGFLPILGFALYRRVLRPEHLRHAHHFLVMALLATVFYYYAFAKGTALLPSSVAGMLSGAIPLFSFVLATVFLRNEAMTIGKILGVASGFAGVLLIARPWSAAEGLDLHGVGYMLCGALSLGTSFVYARRFMANLALSPLALCTYQVGLALFLLALITDLNGITHIATDTRALAGVVFGLGFTGTGVAYVLYYFIVQRMGAMQASAVTYLPPVVALLVGCLFAGEPLRALDLLAMAGVLAGVRAIQGRDSKAHAEKATRAS